MRFDLQLNMDTGSDKYSYGSHNFEVGILTRF